MESFNDIREIQQHLKAKGAKLTTEVAENSNGPANFLIQDPDGNMILLDQHV